jgi:hypothetical protein
MSFIKNFNKEVDKDAQWRINLDSLEKQWMYMLGLESGSRIIDFFFFWLWDDKTYCLEYAKGVLVMETFRNHRLDFNVSQDPNEPTKLIFKLFLGDHSRPTKNHKE